MKFLIVLNDRFEIIAKYNTELSVEDSVEISKQDYDSIDLENFLYTYVDGAIVKGESIKHPDIEPTYEELIQQTHTMAKNSSNDILINMELGEDTNTKVTTTGDDSLLLMEMLVTIDEKLNKLLVPSK